MEQERGLEGGFCSVISKLMWSLSLLEKEQKRRKYNLEQQWNLAKPNRNRSVFQVLPEELLWVDFSLLLSSFQAAFRPHKATLSAQTIPQALLLA